MHPGEFVGAVPECLFRSSPFVHFGRHRLEQFLLVAKNEERGEYSQQGGERDGGDVRLYDRDIRVKERLDDLECAHQQKRDCGDLSERKEHAGRPEFFVQGYPL
jgi:hypothetical protein